MILPCYCHQKTTLSIRTSMHTIMKFLTTLKVINQCNVDTNKFMCNSWFDHFFKLILLLIYLSGSLNQQNNHSKMIFDNINIRNEENGRAEMKEDNRVPLHVCCCNGFCANSKTRRKNSSCTNHNPRNNQHLKPNSSRVCHNSQKYWLLTENHNFNPY